ncbi:hypothetical protein RHGRI_011262 [Rhododendron griersonianum]|uniref:Uncharacterized protein n=1 Tax=Rhododendron griersonianum TaxID=479676 RepID=A0AAV6KMB9_9ERIC|nr:hypothetical protein RHGRI_011262 [Rhododendron griersonianum]
MRRRSTTAATVVPRSCSVGMGRIDEDRPCEFGEDAIDEDDEVVESAPSDSPPDDFSLFSDPFFLRRRLFSTRSRRQGKWPKSGSGEAVAEEEADGADEGAAEAAGDVDLDRDGEAVACWLCFALGFVNQPMGYLDARSLELKASDIDSLPGICLEEAAGMAKLAIRPAWRERRRWRRSRSLIA